MYTSEKKHKSPDRKGGGGGVNPYGQPDRKISVCFFTPSLSPNQRISHILKIGWA